MYASTMRLVLFVSCCVALAACGTGASGDGDLLPDAMIAADAGGDGGGTLDIGIVDDTGSSPDADEDAGVDATGSDTDPGPDAGGEPRPGGGTCADDFDCPSGTYCEVSFGPAYCNPFPDVGGANCDTDADCVFEDNDGTFCCARAFGSQICTPSAEPGVCGDATGLQGDSCADAGQSACESDQHYCLFAGRDFAYCSQLCRPNGNDCPPDAYCFATGGGQGLCVEYGDTPDYDACADDPTSCEENAFCVEYGGEDDPYAFCTAGCESDAACGEGERCDPFGVCMPDGGATTGTPCVEDRFICGADQFCVAFGGRAARCSELCSNDGQCDDDFRCNFFEPGSGYCIPRGERRSGEYCGDDPFSCAGLCNGGYQQFDRGAYCLDVCSRDSDCPDNGACEDFGESGRFCQPAGDVTQGGSCALDPFDCAAGFLCIDYGDADATCAARCFGDADCSAGTWCSGDADTEGVCLPSGDVRPGETCDAGTWTCEDGGYCAGYAGSELCFVQCTDDPTGCPAGQYCLDANEFGARWCFPEGERGYGEGCVGEPYACAEGLFCIDPATPQARCSRACSADSACEGGDVCRRDGASGACVPPGDVPALGSCAGDVYACEPGTTCLLAGTPGAFCGDECTGFAGACDEGTACRFVGYGRSFCMATGDVPAGGSCADDRFACEDGTWCVNAGTPDAVCVTTCSFDPDVCADETTCRFVEGGLGVCLRAGLSPEDPLNPGGSPL